MQPATVLQIKVTLAATVAILVGPELATILKNRQSAMSLLNLSIKDDLIKVFDNFMDPIIVWMHLRQLYHTLNNVHVLYFRDLLSTLKMTEGQTMSKYLKELRGNPTVAYRYWRSG